MSLGAHASSRASFAINRAPAARGDACAPSDSLLFALRSFEGEFLMSPLTRSISAISSVAPLYTKSTV